MKILNAQSALLAYSEFTQRKPRPYFAMYSSIFGGIVVDPSLMTIPMDDHMVHRGDGIFEAMKCVEGAIYDMDAHLRRLQYSANGTSLELPQTLDEIKKIVVATVRASQKKDGTIRIFVSRGPGDFSPNPYSTTGSQLYVVYTASAPYRDELYTQGATLGISQYLAKPRPFCTIKSCNYLTNVLMKKEAVDRGLDFVLATTSTGEITESSTENIAIVDQEGFFVAPPFDDMLRGTTLERVMTLVSEHGALIGLKGSKQKPLHEQDFRSAQAAIVVGTTMSIMPVRSFENVTYTPVKDLPWLKPLSELFKADIQNNAQRRTLVDF